MNNWLKNLLSKSLTLKVLKTCFLDVNIVSTSLSNMCTQLHLHQIGHHEIYQNVHENLSNSGKTQAFAKNLFAMVWVYQYLIPRNIIFP